MSKDIISQENSVVKSLMKWAEKRVTKSQISKKMIQAGFERRGWTMAKCGDSMAIEYCQSCGTHHIRSTNLCRDKLCPVCRWRLSLKRYAQMTATMDVLATEYPAAKYAFMTLTVKNCEVSNLRKTLKEMSKAWNRLLQRKIMKNNIQGWARSVEYTYNAKTKTLHPHYHVILMLAPKITPDELQASKIAHEWETAMRLPYTPIIDIRAIKQGTTGDISGAVCETFKYTVKDYDLNQMPLEVFGDFVGQTCGLRAMAFGGEIKKIRALLGYTEKDSETIETTEETLITCPKCGTEMQTAIFEWARFDEPIREKGLLDILKKAKLIEQGEQKNDD